MGKNGKVGGVVSERRRRRTWEQIDRVEQRLLDRWSVDVLPAFHVAAAVAGVKVA